MSEGNQDSKADLKCKYCGSSTKEAVVKSALWGSRGLVLIEDIPARVCEKCKEQFYDTETTLKLNNLTAYGFPPKQAIREIVVPVFSLAHVEISKTGHPEGVKFEDEEDNPYGEED